MEQQSVDCENQAEIMARIHKKCCPTFWSKEEFESLLKNDYNHILIAYEGQEGDKVPAAFVLFQKLEGSEEAEILTLCTLPSFRRRGLATSLLKAIGVSKTILEVNENSLEAISIYEKMGFETINRRKEY